MGGWVARCSLCPWTSSSLPRRTAFHRFEVHYADAHGERR